MMTKQYLIDEYVNKNKSTISIAEEMDCSPQTVSYWLNKYEIPTRKTTRLSTVTITKEYLIREYNENKRTIKDIASEFKCDPATIRNRVKNYGLPFNSRESEDLTGQVFGKWLLLEQKIKRNYKFYTCKCSCGKVKDVWRTNLVNGRSTCCTRCAHPSSFKHSKWKGCGELSGRRWKEIQSNARRNRTREIPFEITIDYCWSLFLSQDRKCALTSLPIRFKQSYKDPEQETASLDRIDSKKGYLVGNIQWVHKTIQKMKMELPQHEFIKMCCLVASNDKFRHSKKIQSLE